MSGTKNWKSRKIKQVIDDLSKGDRLIVPEFSRLGRSMLEIMEMLSILKDREVNVYAIKGDWELNGSLQSKIMAMVFSIASKIKHLASCWVLFFLGATPGCEVELKLLSFL